MKRLFLFWTIFLTIPVVSAQEMPAYSFTHTGDDRDGYFEFSIEISPQSKPLNIENIFVVHFPSEEQKRYRPILQYIQNYGYQIITKERFDNTYQTKRNTQYFFLGKEYENYPFYTHHQNNSLEEFEAVLQNQLLPVYMKDVEIDFGGNIYEIYPSKIPLLTEQNNIFWGRFKTDIPTRMTVRANTVEGYIITSTLLDFANPAYALLESTNYIGEFWEEAKQIHDPETQAKINTFISWSNLFPIVLLVLGVLIIGFGFIMFGRRLKEESILPEGFLDDAPKTVIDKKEKEMLTQAAEEEDLPFEVYLKNERKD